MSEPTSETKQDSFEDSSSSGDWTFVDKSANIKEANNSVKEEMKAKDVNESETPVDSENSKKAEKVEELQEQKDEDSEDEEVEKGEEAGEKDVDSDDVSVISDEEPEHLTYQEKRIEKLERNQLNKASDQSNDAIAKKYNVRLFLSLLLGLSILSAMMMFLSFMAFVIIKIQELHTLQESSFQTAYSSMDELNSASEFKQNLDNLHQVINSLDNFNNKVPEIQNLVNDLTKNVNNFIKVNNEHTFKHVSSKIEWIAALYESYCSVFATLNPAIVKHKRTCEIPKILHKMVAFDKKWSPDHIDENMKQIREEYQKEFFTAINEDKLEIDTTAEIILNDFVTAFAKFAIQVQEMEEINFRSNAFINDESNKDNNNAKKDNESPEKEQVTERSKGELKNGWKKNKYENKEKLSFEEKKINKRELYESYKKNNHRRLKPERGYGDESRENSERIFNRKIKIKKNEELKPREGSPQFPKKNDYFEKKDRDNDYKNKKNNKENEFERKFDNSKKIPDYDNKSEYEKNEDDGVVYYQKEKYNRESNHNKYCESGHNCNKKKYDDDDDDDDDDEDENEHYFYKDPNNYAERRESKDADWLSKRGSDREKQRNSDWYSARADSRQWARTEEEEEQQQHNNKPYQRHRFQQPGMAYRPKKATWSYNNNKLY